MIKNRFIDKVIFEDINISTLKEEVETAIKNNIDLFGANLYKANLPGANLHGANLSKADLPEANLYGANLRKAILCDCNLNHAIISYRNKKIKIIFEEVKR